MKLKRSISAFLLVTIGISGLQSCKNTFDISPENAIDASKTYQTIYDADAAVLGVYGQFMKLAAQYEILNELRADLMTTTENSDVFLQQINDNKITADNPYINPKAFYTVITSCNDVMANLKKMYDSKKINEGNFQQRYSDIAALRTWLYFQLGIQYGEIPYVTEPLANVNDVKDSGKFPRIKLKELVQELIKSMESLPYLQPYAEGSSLLSPIDGYPSKVMFVNKEALLGDLHLWNKNYNEAATYYKKVLETTTPLGANAPNGAYYNFYVLSSGENNDAVATGNWQQMFSRPATDVQYQYEWIWSMFFDKSSSPENPFINLFANTGTGKYLVKPSQNAIDNWNSQVQNDASPYDFRGLNNTYKIINGKPVIMKFLYNYLNSTTGNPVNVLEKNGRWFIYRAAHLHLRFAEAANRDGHTKLAYAFINNGVKSVYDDLALPIIDRRMTHLPAPYDMDARKLDAPTIRGKYHRQLGIRGRVTTANLPAELKENSKMLEMEDAIINEGALEVAYEGNRWQDLVRIALRRDDVSFINNLLFKKTGNANTFQKVDDLFLPFNF